MPSAHDPDPPEPAIRWLLRLVMPPLCPGCGRAADPARAVCRDCMRSLNRTDPIRDDPPEGVSRVASCAPHEGLARRLLAAYKFRGVTVLCGLLSGYMADLAGPGRGGQTVVPVPPSPVRRRLGGFDPVEPLAAEIARSIPAGRLRTDLLIRCGNGRQRGRSRAGRLGSPPDIRFVAGAEAEALGSVLLVDDVMTTGATLAVSAAVLRTAGAGPIRAITFTRRL